MKNNKSAKLNRLLMLIMVFMMLLVLSGCRTRISNNTEVASTITDEDGWLTEIYQERRDDLEMPVAKKPFITGTNQDEEYSGEGYDRDMEELDDYADDPWEDEEDVFGEEEDEETSSSSTSTSSSTTSSTTTRRPSSTTVRRRTTTSTTRRKTTTTTKKKTSTGSSKKDTQQPETPKAKFTVTFDGSAADMSFDPITVEEGSKIGKLPNIPKTFGWFTEDGTEVTSDFIIGSDVTIYARPLSTDPPEPTQEEIEKEWSDFFDKTANKVPAESQGQVCLIQGDAGKFFKGEDFRVNTTDTANPKFIIKFAGKDEDCSDAAAQTLYEGSISDPAAPPERAIIIPEEVVKNDSGVQLYYRLLLLDILYGNVGQENLDAAANALSPGKAPLTFGVYPPLT